MSYTIYIAGTSRAKSEWKSGATYKSRSSALRRLRQIKAAHDVGVGAIWLVPASLAC